MFRQFPTREPYTLFGKDFKGFQMNIASICSLNLYLYFLVKMYEILHFLLVKLNISSENWLLLGGHIHTLN